MTSRHIYFGKYLPAVPKRSRAIHSNPEQTACRSRSSLPPLSVVPLLPLRSPRLSPSSLLSFYSTVPLLTPLPLAFPLPLPFLPFHSTSSHLLPFGCPAPPSLSTIPQYFFSLPPPPLSHAPLPFYHARVLRPTHSLSVAPLPPPLSTIPSARLTGMTPKAKQVRGVIKNNKEQPLYSKSFHLAGEMC